MSTCACMLVKDEEDIVGWTLGWLFDHVDEVLVVDNGSMDETRDVIRSAGLVPREAEGYRYSDIISGLAREAHERGHRWVVPVDADEVWQAPEERQRLGDWLESLPEDVQTVRGAHRNYLPTAADDPTILSPFLRIRWRLDEWGWPKVACRARPDLVISHGAHAATPEGNVASGIVVRHFSWRSLGQCIMKNRRGILAYANTAGLKQNDDEHWRQWEGRTDDEIAEHFYREHYSADPANDPRFVYDPVTL